MVDNENQWEDMEYSNDSGDVEEYESDEYVDDEYSKEEYSDQEYEEYEDGEEYYDDEAAPAQKKGNPAGCIIILLLLLLIIGGVAFFFLSGKNSGEKAPVASQNNEVVVESQSAPVSDSTTALGDEFFNEAGGDSTDMMSVDFSTPGETTVTTSDGNEEIVATVMEVPVEQQTAEMVEIPQEEASSENVDDLFPQESMANVDLGQGTSEIMVAYNKKARVNPFKPPVIQKHSDLYSTIGGTEFEIIEPPTTSVSDENLTRLLQTQISGILYDDESPSAIVNLNGVDQFVKIGDTVSGYTIEDITKDKVQITYKNNTYVASVGELFTRGALEKKRAVADLENKFAGRYRNNN